MAKKGEKKKKESISRRSFIKGVGSGLVGSIAIAPTVLKGEEKTGKKDKDTDFPYKKVITLHVGHY